MRAPAGRRPIWRGDGDVSSRWTLNGKAPLDLASPYASSRTPKAVGQGPGVRRCGRAWAADGRVSIGRFRQSTRETPPTVKPPSDHGVRCLVSAEVVAGTGYAALRQERPCRVGLAGLVDRTRLLHNLRDRMRCSRGAGLISRRLSVCRLSCSVSVSVGPRVASGSHGAS